MRAGRAERAEMDAVSLDRAARVYRMATWAYPRRWRVQYADEVLGVLLQAGAGTVPQVDGREVCSLVGNGLLVRVEALFGACGRRTREVAAGGAAAMLVVVSVAALVFGEWLPWRAGAPLLSLEGADAAAAWQATRTLFAAPGLGAVVCATALLGGLATVAGRARAGQGWFAATAAVALVMPLVTAAVPVNRPLLLHLALVFGLAVVAAAAPVRVRPGRRVVVAVAVSLLAAAFLLWVASVTRVPGWSLTFYNLQAVTRPVSDAVCWVTVPAALVVASVPALRRHAGSYALMFLPWWLQQAGFQQLRRIVAPGTVPAFIVIAGLFAAAAMGVAHLRRTYRIERVER